MIKKTSFLIILLTILFISNSNAQQGYKYIYADYGHTLGRTGHNISIGLDFPNKYHHSWDIGLRGYFKQDYESVFLALRYKPLIYKGVNSTFKGRLGAIGGSDFSNAIFAPELGVEFSQTIAFGVDLYLATDLGYYINSPIDNWRLNAIAGLKFRF